MNNNDIQHLQWIYERMIHVHNENENYDYMIKFRSILEALHQPIVMRSVCECKVCGKPFGDKLSLYEHYDETHNK